MQISIDFESINDCCIVTEYTVLVHEEVKCKEYNVI